MNSFGIQEIELPDLDDIHVEPILTENGVDASDDDIEKLLADIENETLNPKWKYTMIPNANELPPALQDKLVHFFNWNEDLLPKLRYRLETAYTELPEWNARAWLHTTHVTWLPAVLDRIVWWLHFFEQNIRGYPLKAEGEKILNLLHEKNLPLLEHAFRQVFDYNIKFSGAKKQKT